jgi:hypothetical protein
MVAEAKRRNPELADRYVEGTVESYEFPEGKFDFVSTIGVLATACTRETFAATARKIARTLRPGGRVLMLEGFHVNGLLTRGCRMTGREVATTFEAEGLRLEILDGMLFFPIRMVICERPFRRFPAMTQYAFRRGEKLLRLAPLHLGDYAVVGLTKPT